jgi:hypothetical protein
VVVTPEQISAAVADAIDIKKEQLLEDRWACYLMVVLSSG